VALPEGINQPIGSGIEVNKRSKNQNHRYRVMGSFAISRLLVQMRSEVNYHQSPVQGGTTGHHGLSVDSSAGGGTKENKLGH
jgi:hypothetical protein